MSDTPSLAGRAVLLVEDEYFVMQRLRKALQVIGVIVVGPASNVAAALALVHSGVVIDAAILDINLLGDLVFPVADALGERGVPFAFATGYDPDVIPVRHAAVPLLRKPVDPDAVAEALFAPRP